MEIYTLGTSTRSLEEFIEILRYFKIEMVIDVRHFPTSKRYPWFSKENLEKALPKEGIDYTWLEELGGYRKEGYLAYTQTEEYKKGLNRVIELAKEKRICLICAEKLWFRCHRRFIADDLVLRGIKVIHIYDKGSIHEHRYRDMADRVVWCDKKARKLRKSRVLI